MASTRRPRGEHRAQPADRQGGLGARGQQEAVASHSRLASKGCWVVGELRW